METRSNKRKRQTDTRESQAIRAITKVIKLKRPGAPNYNEPTPSTSGILQNKLNRDVDKLNPTPDNTKNDKEKCQKDNATLTPLCTACKEIPRIQRTGLSVLQCRNGHIICTICKPKLVSCPICRSTETDNRSLFVEEFIKRNLQHKPNKCRHDPCVVNLRMHDGDLAGHEAFCIYREGNCLNNLCHWHGNLNNLISHIKEKNCGHINLDVDCEKRGKQPTFEGSYTFKFANTLLFPNNNPNIFLQISTKTTFKPILLIANGITNLYCYLLIERSAEGTWTFMVCSKLEPEDTDNIKVTLQIGDIKANYTHSTRILSYRESKDHVREQGNFMELKDAQIKRLNSGKQLFHFEVLIQPDTEFIKEANTKANMGRQYTLPNETNVNYKSDSVNLNDH